MRLVITVIVFFLYSFANAQVSVIFDPVSNPRSLQTIAQVSLINSGAPSTAVLDVEVRTGQGELVVKLRTSSMHLATGTTSMASRTTAIASMQFGSGRIAQAVRTGAPFPPGNYEFCYIILEDGKTGSPALLGQECFPVDLSPIGNIELVYPANRDSLCSAVTTLQWTPIIPAPQGVQYQLYLTELRADQTPAEAIVTNLPVVNARNLVQNFYSLQQYAHLLQKGKQYTWQVIGSVDEQPLDRSEVWTFIYDCPVDPPLPKGESYRSIDNMQWGNYLRVKEILRFSINNPYGKLPIKYSIRNLADFSAQVRQLPKLVLQHGMNYVDIDLTDCKGLENGKSYELIVQLPGHSPKKLLFIYE